MKVSAGIIIKWQDKILLCHPTGRSWKNTFTPPKGGVNPGEEIMAAAIRETLEEVGIAVKPEQLNQDPIKIEYLSDKTKVRKIVYLFTCQITELLELGLGQEVLEKSRLQQEEIDWAGFLTRDQAAKSLFWRYDNIW